MSVVVKKGMKYFAIFLWKKAVEKLFNKFFYLKKKYFVQNF